MFSVSYPYIPFRYRVLGLADLNTIGQITLAFHRVANELAIHHRNPNQLDARINVYHPEDCKDGAPLVATFKWKNRRFAELRFDTWATVEDVYASCRIWKAGRKFPPTASTEWWKHLPEIISPPPI